MRCRGNNSNGVSADVFPSQCFLVSLSGRALTLCSHQQWQSSQKPDIFYWLNCWKKKIKQMSNSLRMRCVVWRERACSSSQLLNPPLQPDVLLQDWWHFIGNTPLANYFKKFLFCFIRTFSLLSDAIDISVIKHCIYLSDFSYRIENGLPFWQLYKT